MSIAVEDWDDLVEAPRGKGRCGQDAKRDPAPEREPAREPDRAPEPSREPRPVVEPSPVLEATPVPEPIATPATPMRARITARAPSAPPPTAIPDWDEIPGVPQPKAATAPEPTLGVANFKDDDYGDTLENLRIPAGIAGVNALFWLVGRVFGVVELVGVAFFVSIGLLLAAYMLHEWQRERTSLICLAGALPLPLTIISLFV